MTKYTIKSLLKSFTGLTQNSKKIEIKNSFKFVGNKKRITPVISRFGQPVNDFKTPLKILASYDSVFMDPGLELKDNSLNTDRNQIANIVSLIEQNFKGRLKNKRSQQLSIISLVKLQSIKNVKGIRHMLGYPSNGQRTKTNGKTATRIKQIQAKVAILTTLGFK